MEKKSLFTWEHNNFEECCNVIASCNIDIKRQCPSHQLFSELLHSSFVRTWWSWPYPLGPCVPISSQITQYSNFGKFILRNPIDSDGHCANFSITAYTLIHKQQKEIGISYIGLDTFSWKELFTSLEKLQPLIKLIQWWWMLFNKAGTVPELGWLMLYRDF